MEALYRRQQSRVHGVCPRKGDIPSSAVSPVPDTGILLTSDLRTSSRHDNYESSMHSLIERHVSLCSCVVTWC